MGQGSLVTEEINAGADLIRRLDRSIPVRAAFWVKDSEEGQWYLYITSDQFDDNSLDAGYGEVLRLADPMANPYFDPFQVKLIPTSDPLAQAVLNFHRRYPSNMTARLGAQKFGDQFVESVHIYPSPVATPAP